MGWASGCDARCSAKRLAKYLTPAAKAEYSVRSLRFKIGVQENETCIHKNAVAVLSHLLSDE